MNWGISRLLLAAGTTTTVGLSNVIFSRPASDRRGRPGRLREDRADGSVVQVAARALRHRRDHQRYLYEMGCGIPRAFGFVDAGSHRWGRDRRLPAYCDPR